MDPSFNLACVQMDCTLGNVKANLNKIKRIARAASMRKPDVIVFPELATTGYLLRSKWRNLAEEIPGQTTDDLAKIASECGAYVVCGIDEKDRGTGNIFDSAVILDPAGKLCGTYRKVHLWGEEKKHFTRGDSFPVFKTKICTIGIGICYDLEFPECARTLALKGAELIVFPSAEIDPMSRQIDSYLVSRSAENCIFVGFSNRVGKEGSVSFFGHTQILAQDTTMVRAKRGESFVTRELNVRDLEPLRQKFLPYLNERQPGAYS